MFTDIQKRLENFNPEIELDDEDMQLDEMGRDYVKLARYIASAGNYRTHALIKIAEAIELLLKSEASDEKAYYQWDGMASKYASIPGEQD